MNNGSSGTKEKKRRSRRKQDLRCGHWQAMKRETPLRSTSGRDQSQGTGAGDAGGNNERLRPHVGGVKYSLENSALVGGCRKKEEGRGEEERGFVRIRVRGATSDEKQMHDEDGLQNQCALLVIGIGPPCITRYTDAKSERKKRTPPLPPMPVDAEP